MSPMSPWGDILTEQLRGDILIDQQQLRACALTAPRSSAQSAPTMNLYRDMDRVALDAAYNNSAAVVGSGKILANWQARSDRLAAQRSKYLDLRYGEAERNRIDLFVGKVGAPVLVFI